MESDVSQLVTLFEDAEHATADARKLSERDRDYYDGKQWTPAEVRALNARKQPVVTFNRIQRKVDYRSGLEKQMRKDPKAFPRNPEDEAAADAATDAIRFVCDDENWDDKRSSNFDDLQVEGVGILMVGHKETRQGVDPAIFHVPWDRFFYDPHSRRVDFSDASYMGIVTWYDLDTAKEKGWPEEILESTMNEGLSDTYDDRPEHKKWCDRKRRRIRVIELYRQKKGAWHRVVYTSSGVLEEEQPSPYMDEEGQPENPIKATSCYVDRDNNRYGAVRSMISPQDEINKRRSKGLHLITMRQARIGVSSSVDKEDVRRELAKPDGIVTAEDDDFEILDTNDMAAANLQMLQEAKAEIDLLGANAALAGKNENDMSGRAILAQQQGGMVEEARLFDRLRCQSIEVYRAVWNRIRQFWNEERWVRIADNDNHLRFVGLNQKVTVRMLAEEVAQGDQEAMQKAAQLVGAPLLEAYLQGDERAQMALGMFVQQNGDQVVEVRNAVNELDIDIVIDEGMDTPTVQAEQFDTLAKVIPGIVNLPLPYAKMLIQASSLRDKDAILEMLEQQQQQDPMAAQMAQVMGQLQVQGAQADVEKTQSETMKNVAQAQTAVQGTNDPVEQAIRAQEASTDQFRANTERMEAGRPAQ